MRQSQRGRAEAGASKARLDAEAAAATRCAREQERSSETPNHGVRVSGFGSLGFRGLSLGVRFGMSGLGSRVEGLGFRVPKLQTPNAQPETSENRVGALEKKLAAAEKRASQVKLRTTARVHKQKLTNTTLGDLVVKLTDTT